jgi:hypothetical protein
MVSRSRPGSRLEKRGWEPDGLTANRRDPKSEILASLSMTKYLEKFVWKEIKATERGSLLLAPRLSKACDRDQGRNARDIDKFLNFGYCSNTIFSSVLIIMRRSESRLPSHGRK